MSPVSFVGPMSEEENLHPPRSPSPSPSTSSSTSFSSLSLPPPPSSRSLSSLLSSPLSFLSDSISPILTSLSDQLNQFLDTLTDSAISFLSSLLFSFLSLLYPLLKILFYLLFSFLFANLVYFILYKLFFPIELIDEILHINYSPPSSPLSSSTFPIAKLQLSSPENQWQYLTQSASPSPTSSNSFSSHEKSCQRFLHINSEYEIKLKFHLSKSPNNQNLRKCMVDLKMIDCAGDVIGHSARVLRVPYSSLTLAWIRFLLQLPWLALGYAEENEMIEVEMMNNYRERGRNAVPTDVVEVLLSPEAHQMDIEKVSLSILPLPTGIAYYMYYFPYASFIGGVLFLFYYFIGLLLLLHLAQSPIMRRTMGFILSDDNEGDSPTAISDDIPMFRASSSSSISPSSPSPLLRRARQLRQDRLRFPVNDLSSREEEIVVEEEKVWIPYRRRMFGESPPHSAVESKSSLDESEDDDDQQQQQTGRALVEDSAAVEEAESDAWSDIAIGTLRERKKKRN